uniref:Kazal-like domain-containing protein n=1 Tax=Falco tinnunculus TaxID=100819 RepID=A0A8C4UN51_FALTI
MFERKQSTLNELYMFVEIAPNVTSFSLQLDCDRILHGVKGGRIFCSESSQPVCGTDGKTYKNECDLLIQGECRKPAPEVVSSTAGLGKHQSFPFPL